MAAQPPIKRITREDLKDAPQWVDRLLYPLNLFMDSVYGSLSHLLSFQDNFLCQIYSFSLTAGAAATNNTLKFLLNMKRRPSHMLILSASANTSSDIRTGGGSTITWNYDGTNVNITSISGLTNGTVYDMTVLLI